MITDVKASAGRCFDMARDLDLHLESMAETGERAIGGKTSGLIGLDEEVTWEASTLGFVSVSLPVSRDSSGRVTSEMRWFEGPSSLSSTITTSRTAVT